MWADRSEAVLRVITRALVDLRDAGRLELDPTEYHRAMTLTAVMEMRADRDVDPKTRRGLENLLSSLPGYDPTRIAAEQRQCTVDHFECPAFEVAGPTMDYALRFLDDPLNVGATVSIVDDERFVEVTWPNGRVDRRTAIVVDTEPGFWVSTNKKRPT